MEKELIIEKLKQVDKWLEQGDRDHAHFLIIKLLEELNDPARKQNSGKKDNKEQNR